MRTYENRTCSIDRKVLVKRTCDVCEVTIEGPGLPIAELNQVCSPYLAECIDICDCCFKTELLPKLKELIPDLSAV